MKSDLVFVYGTLRRSVRPDIHERFLGEQAEFVGRGTVPGRLWRVSWYPALTRAEQAVDRVVGEVFRLRDALQMLSELDDFEVCDLSNPAKSEYTRELLEVALEDDSTVQAWCYIYLGEPDDLEWIRSGDFSV